MNITEECPLGKTCFTEKDDIAKRCKWYISFMATGSEGEQIEKWHCSLVWIPLLQIEMLTFLREKNRIKSD